MIQRNTPQWENLIFNFKVSKSKSNRDVMCAKCWEILNYEVCRLHKIQKPDHEDHIITSREYTNERRFMSLAREHGRSLKINNVEFYENPYKEKHGRGQKSSKFRQLETIEREDALLT